MRFWPIVGSGLIAGLIAGLILGALTLALLTPLILTAEKYESYPGKAAEGHSNQRNVGTLAGAVIIGTVYGLGLALLYGATSKTPLTRPVVRGLGLGLLAYTIISLVPSMVFLPNPPGVEAKASTAVRQIWWLAIILLELAGIGAYRVITRRTADLNPWIGRSLGSMAFIGLALAPLFFGPPNALSEVSVPAGLLFDFRLTALTTLLVFWSVLGALVALVYARLQPDAKQA